MLSYLRNLNINRNPYFGQFANWQLRGEYAVSPDGRSEVYVSQRFTNFQDSEGNFIRNIKSKRERRLIYKELVRLRKAHEASKKQTRNDVIALIAKYNNVQNVEF